MSQGAIIGIMLLIACVAGIIVYFLFFTDKDACTSPVDTRIAEEECNPECTTGPDIPYVGCILPVCTAADKPWPGCDNHCTAVDKPYSGCTVPNCTAVVTPYSGCNVPNCTTDTSTPYLGCTVGPCESECRFDELVLDCSTGGGLCADTPYCDYVPETAEVPEVPAAVATCLPPDPPLSDSACSTELTGAAVGSEQSVCEAAFCEYTAADGTNVATCLAPIPTPDDTICSTAFGTGSGSDCAVAKCAYTPEVVAVPAVAAVSGSCSNKVNRVSGSLAGSPCIENNDVCNEGCSTVEPIGDTWSNPYVGCTSPS